MEIKDVGVGERDTHPNSMQNLGIRKREKK